MRRPFHLCLATAGVLALAWGLVGCGQAVDPWKDVAGSPRVVVTIAPLYSLVRGVAGDRAAIQCLCTTTGPHHYHLDTRDARILAKADLFLAVGLRLDDNFADGMRSVARRPDLPYVKLGTKLPESSLLEMKHEHKHGDGDDDHGHEHHHGKWDPHVWLGVPEVIAMVETIRDELCKVDPGHASEYGNNASAYVARLKKVQQDGKKLLAEKTVRRIISFHEALAYFARSFDLEIADVIEVAPGAEPAANHLAKIVKLCQKPGEPIGAIAVEPQYPKSTSAGTVQKELQARGVKVPLVEIDPMETANVADLEKEGAGWYEARMRKNLEALAKALP
jgi:ABC-type Zn uptake system ZnuABC Zn-binding protein ZnuA